MKVGYLVSQYPATSHTFIGRQIEAVRALGVTAREAAAASADRHLRRKANDSFLAEAGNLAY